MTDHNLQRDYTIYSIAAYFQTLSRELPLFGNIVVNSQVFTPESTSELIQGINRFLAVLIEILKRETDVQALNQQLEDEI